MSVLVYRRYLGDVRTYIRQSFLINRKHLSIIWTRPGEVQLLSVSPFLYISIILIEVSTVFHVSRNYHEGKRSLFFLSLPKLLENNSCPD